MTRRAEGTWWDFVPAICLLVVFLILALEALFHVAR